MAHRRRPRLWGPSLIALSGMLLLAACGSSGGSGASAANSAGATGHSSSIQISLIGDLSGSQAQNGDPLTAGVTAAFKSINDAGGINGAKFELNTIDAMTSPQAAQAAVRQVQGMNPPPAAVILGTSAASLAAVGSMFAAQPNQTVIAGTILDQYVLPKPAPWFFSIAQPSAATAKYMVDGLKNILGTLQGKSVALVGLQNPAVDQGLAAMTKLVESDGGHVVITEHDTAGMTSFASQAADVAAARPDGVLTYTSVDNTIIDAQALVAAGVKAPILGNDAASDTAIFRKVNAPNFYAVRIYVEPQPGDTLTSAAQKYGVSQYAPMAYFSRGWAIAQVLDRAFKACSVPCKDLSSAIEGLGSFKIPGAVIGTVTFSKQKHYGADQAQLFAWRNGKAGPVGNLIDISNLAG